MNAERVGGSTTAAAPPTRIMVPVAAPRPAASAASAAGAAMMLPKQEVRLFTARKHVLALVSEGFSFYLKVCHS